VQLRHYLSQQPGKFALTTDIWSAPHQQSYLGMTIHWIDANWELHAQLLDIVPLYDAHSAENITEQLCAVLTDFAIGEKILSITTDNAANMVKMGKLLCEQALLRFNNSNIIHLRCAAHVLNIGVKAGLEHISDSVQKARRFAGKLRNSQTLLREMRKLAEGIEEPFLMPELDVPTRWNSTYSMLVRLKDIKGVTDALVHKIPSLSNDYLTEEDRRTLQVSDSDNIHT
jgi:hypothetical protein